MEGLEESDLLPTNSEVFVMAVRICVKLVIYNATPGTFLNTIINEQVTCVTLFPTYLNSEGTVPRHKPTTPSEAITLFVTLSKLPFCLEVNEK